MKSLFVVFSSLVNSIFDPKLYYGLTKDIIFSSMVFVFSLLGMILISYEYFGVYKSLFSSSSNSIFSFFITLTSSLLAPILLTFIFFLFKSEKRLSKLALHGLGIEQPVACTNFSFFIYIRVLFFIIIFSILSLLPFVGILFSGLILGFDCLSYVFEALGLKVSDQLNFFTTHYVSSFLIGLVVLSLSFIPFGFFIAYPLGILAMAKFYVKLNSETS